MRTLIILLILIFAACQERKSVQTGELRDSLVSRYIQLGDSIFWTDSLNPHRQMLVAYNRNDTNFLRERVATAKSAVEESNYMLKNLCPEPPRIETLGFSEGYQFAYSAAFCDETLTVTVGLKKDSVKLMAHRYKYEYNVDSCVFLEITSKVLTKVQWSQILGTLDRADFWGLMPYKLESGFDGSSLRVTGYRAPINAYKGEHAIVARRSAEETALGESFKKVWDLSGVKIDCFHYKK